MRSCKTNLSETGGRCQKGKLFTQSGKTNVAVAGTGRWRLRRPDFGIVVMPAMASAEKILFQVTQILE